jgi:hypothetical protein
MTKTTRERPYCTYSFFLFSNLYNVVIPNEIEYDLLYEVVCDEYGKYCDSKYNDPNNPEYECIVEYLYSIDTK